MEQFCKMIGPQSSKGSSSGTPASGTPPGMPNGGHSTVTSRLQTHLEISIQVAGEAGDRGGALGGGFSMRARMAATSWAAALVGRGPLWMRKGGERAQEGGHKARVLKRTASAPALSSVGRLRLVAVYTFK